MPMNCSGDQTLLLSHSIFSKITQLHPVTANPLKWSSNTRASKVNFQNDIFWNFIVDVPFSQGVLLILEKIYFPVFFYEVEVREFRVAKKSFVFPCFKQKIRWHLAWFALQCKIHISISMDQNLPLLMVYASRNTPTNRIASVPNYIFVRVHVQKDHIVISQLWVRIGKQSGFGLCIHLCEIRFRINFFFACFKQNLQLSSRLRFSRFVARFILKGFSRLEKISTDDSLQWSAKA